MTRRVFVLAVLLTCSCGNPEAPSGPVSIIVADDSGPVPGTFVVFSDASGEPLAQLQTNAQGTATHDVPPGAMVTVVGSSSLTTYAGVRAGDVLTHSELVLPAEIVGTARITMPGPVVGADRYRIDIGCAFEETGDPSAPVLLSIRADATRMRSTRSRSRTTRVTTSL